MKLSKHLLSVTLMCTFLNVCKAKSTGSQFIPADCANKMISSYLNVEHINSSKQLTCRLEVSGDDKYISAESQLLAYRIAQEAMHNIFKHANAKTIEIKLTYEIDRFGMTIRYDGVGFTQKEAEAKGMMGLVNMNKRAELLNGTLEIISSPNNGCCVELLVELPSKSA